MQLDHLFSVFEEAGRQISETIDRLPFDEAARITGTGADGTPTRYMDHLCEDIFIRSVKKEGFDYNILSEEAGFVDLGGKSILLVDPLDGTTNALNGIPYYSLSVGVIGSDTRSATAAFIMNLSDMTIYTSEKGGGAFRNGKPIRAGKRSGIYIVNFGRSIGPDIQKIVSRPMKYRKLGSTALDLCLLASGSVDAVFSIGKGSSPRNFDVAAGILLAEEAGGYVSDTNGSPYNLGLDPSDTKDMIGVAERSMVDEFI